MKNFVSFLFFIFLACSALAGTDVQTHVVDAVSAVPEAYESGFLPDAPPMAIETVSEPVSFVKRQPIENKQVEPVSLQKKSNEKRAAQRAASDPSYGRLALAYLVLFLLPGLGLHRVILKSGGLMVLWYFLSFGGIFGILPLIDFFCMAFMKETYWENRGFFGFIRK